MKKNTYLLVNRLPAVETKFLISRLAGGLVCCFLFLQIDRLARWRVALLAELLVGRLAGWQAGWLTN